MQVMTKNSFGSRLLRARVDRGWSQAQLAEASGVAAAQISRYEADKNFPRPHIAAKLADVLSVDAGWLSTGKSSDPDWWDPSDPTSRMDQKPTGLVDSDAVILDQAQQIWSLRCRLSATNTMLLLAVKLLEDAKFQDKEVLRQVNELLRSNAPHVAKVTKFALDGFQGDPPWTDEMQALEKRLQQLEKSED